MSDTITITGLVATAARHLVTAEGLPITSFRLASSQRRFDRTTQKWVDGDTNWYSVVSFRQLAINAASSINKGDRVVVTGRLRVREWDTGERKGVNVDVEAESLGHDLLWGTSTFNRSISASSTAAPVEESSEGEVPAALEPELAPHVEPEPEPALPF